MSNVRDVSMKPFALFLLIACISLAANARLARSFSFDELRSNADLVVIATPITIKEIAERAPLPDIMQGNEPVMGSGIETTFNILAILKGDTKLKNFVLHHYSVTGPQLNGPGLVSFNPSQKKTFLLFLKRSPDGRYVAVSGQTDPNISIKAITGVTDDP